MLSLMNEQQLQEYQAARNACGIIDFSDYGQAVVRGEDRLEWLQGQVTNDLRLIEAGNSIEFCFCSPTGQIITTARIWDRGTEYLLDTPPDTMKSLLARLNDLIIMEDVELEDRSNERFLLSIQGPTANQMLKAAFAVDELPKTRSFVAHQYKGYELLIVNQDRTRNGGFELLGSNEIKSEILQLLIASGAVPISYEVWEVLRLEAGIPVLGKELTEKTLPPEAGKTFDQQMVSYNKGCYTGQEVLMRIHSRGHTNRTLAALAIHSENVPKPSTPLLSVEHPNPGMIASAVFSPAINRPLALAYVRNELSSVGTQFQVEIDGETARALVIELPIGSNLG